MRICLVFIVVLPILFAGCGEEQGGPTQTAQVPIIFPGTMIAQDCTTTTLECRIDPRGSTTTLKLEYGLALEGQESSWTKVVGHGYGPVQARAILKSLLPEERYSYRWQASSAGGVAVSEVDTFITLPANCPPETWVSPWPPEGSPEQGYSILVYFSSLDVDGITDHYEWRTRVRGVWGDWVATEGYRRYISIEAGDEVGWRFEIRAVDNDGCADPTPAWFEWIWPQIYCGPEPARE
jgi:hypothetical protein